MTAELFPSSEQVRHLSLARLSGEVARSLARLGRIAVDAEVHRPAHRPGGRIYFIARDRAAQVSVVCPQARARHCRVVQGERVRITGRLTYANERGQLQLEAEEVVPVGAGAVAAMIADTRRRLADEGLLTRPRRPLPRLPAAIGVVCGADAAVRADIESVVAARFPGYPVVFAEVTVSGPGAAEAIAGAIVALDARPDVEVMIVARGGGDATQLLPFSDEDLCRAVCASSTPVVSAVGHEGDRPLCDEVADARCGTPSIAAALVVPDRAALEAEIDRHLIEVRAGLVRRVDAGTRCLAGTDPRGALSAGLTVARGRLDSGRRSLALVHPSRQLAACRGRLAQLDVHAPVAVRIAGARRRHEAVNRQLDALDPRRVLERGYAIVRDADGRVVRAAAELASGDPVDVELASGGITVRVEQVRP